MEIIVIVAFAVLLLWLLDRIPSDPSVCPSCKKEYEKLEQWSYGDYMWGARCPHCKYEFDITP